MGAVDDDPVLRVLKREWEIAMAELEQQQIMVAEVPEPLASWPPAPIEWAVRRHDLAPRLREKTPADYDRHYRAFIRTGDRGELAAMLECPLPDRLTEDVDVYLARTALTSHARPRPHGGRSWWPLVVAAIAISILIMHMMVGTR